MSEKTKDNLTIIDGAKKAEITELNKPAGRHTTIPIHKKLIEFRKENSGKFSVLDLFKK
ncbi:hypothetical protein J6E39_03595 [bacterium]|nr:hypothetical protein [bacterium]